MSMSPGIRTRPPASMTVVFADTAFYIAFAIVLSTLMPVVIMPLFHKFEPLEEGDLTAAVRAMMEENTDETTDPAGD